MDHLILSTNIWATIITTGVLMTQSSTVPLAAPSLASVPAPALESEPLPGSLIRRLYKESCNKTHKCDSRAWLGCFKKHCDCIKQEEMLYVTEYQKCVSKSGERCTFAVDDDEDFNFVMEVSSCVPNARCTSEGICDCDPKFYADLQGTCTPAFGHLQKCETEEQCSRYQALHCLTEFQDLGPGETHCRCNETISIYSGISNEDEHEFVYNKPDPQCLGLAGFPCINSKCVENAVCLDQKCLCTDEYYPNEEGLCVQKIPPLKNCTASFQCEQKAGQKFVCISGLCDCDPEVSMLQLSMAAIKFSDENGFGYHSHSHGRNFQEENKNFHGFEGPTLFQCVGLVGSNCIDRLCTRNAYCAYPVYQDQDLAGEPGACKCQPEYTESKFHTCAMGYEKPCSASSTCIDELVCRNSKCLCPFITQTFDEKRKTCLNLVGGPCNSSLSCELRAECIKTKKENFGGHCKCREGYVENLVGKCDAGYGTECAIASDCDSIAKLQCVNRKCKCPEFAEFNLGLRKCVGLVGAKCDLGKENECTENAECMQVMPMFDMPGNCTCNVGFEESSSYTCEAVATGVDNANEL